MVTKEFVFPEGITAELSNKTLTVKGPKGEVKREIIIAKEISFKVEGNKLIVSSELDKRIIKAQVGTTIAHAKNMAKGVNKGYEYKMKVIYSHFPVTVKVEGDKIIVNNFLGERVPRISTIVGDAKVDVKKQDITINGIDLEQVSQTAGNLEQTCRIVGYDKKVFQDGIYITHKGK